MRRVLALLCCLLTSSSFALTAAQEAILFSRGRIPVFYANPAANGVIPTGLVDNRTGITYYWDAAGNLQTAPNNKIANSTMAGAGAGSLPTGWSVAVANGLTTTVNSVSTVNGMQTLNVTISGTTTGTYYELLFDANTSETAAQGQTVLGSTYYSITGGSTNNITFMSTSVNMNNSSGTPVASSGICPNMVSTISSTVARCYGSLVLSNAATAYVTPFLALNFSSGVNINITLTISAPQLELVTAAQTTPNPFMPTSGSAYFGPVANDHNPSTLAALGLRSEPQRTNLATNSLSLAGSFLQNATLATPALSPDGGLNARLFTDNATSGNHQLAPSIGTLVSGATYTFSVFVKPVSLRYIALNVSDNANGIIAAFDLQSLTAGAVGTNGTGTTPTSSIVPAGGGWYRLSITGMPSASTAATRIVVYGQTSAASAQWFPSYVGTGQSIYVWQPQLDQNSFATSPILTYGSAVTVPADSWSFAGAALAQMTSGRACIALQTLAEGVTSGRLFSVNDGTASNQIAAYMNSSATQFGGAVTKAGSSSFSSNLNGGNATTASRIYAGAFGGSSFVQSYDGSNASTLSATQPTGLTTAYLARPTTTTPAYYGWFQQIAIWPSCTAAQIKKYSTAGANL